MFQFHVANAFGEPAHEQDLVWKTNRMPKNANWSMLKDEADFEGMLEQAGAILDAELTKFQIATAKNVADAAKAQKKGKTHVPKPVPALLDLVILVRDCHYEQKGKATKKVRQPLF